MSNVIKVRPAVPVVGAGVGLLVGYLKKKSVETTLLYGLAGAGTAYAGAAVVLATPKLSTLIETKKRVKLTAK